MILHPTSLPTRYAVGDLGPAAHAALAWMAAAGLTAWQVLPLVPPETAFWSPYVGLDARAGAPLLLSPDVLAADGLVSQADVDALAASLSDVPPDRVNYERAAAAKNPLLAKAAAALRSHPTLAPAADAWRAANPWVEDSALFAALAEHEPDCVGKAWWEWPVGLRFRDEGAVRDACARHASSISDFASLQFLFDRQWGALKTAANAAGVAMIGDMPIYVGGHSTDVWVHRHLFQLDNDGAPAAVSGVPPDAFSATGQLWGSPLYDWPAHAQEGYAWWGARLARAAALFDVTRVDHFRGFAGYWAVPAAAVTAMEGAWVAGPGGGLFAAVKERVGDVPIVAEDLGVITPDVTSLRLSLGAPGMAVLQFAWGSDSANPHLPHNVAENCAVYTGESGERVGVEATRTRGKIRQPWCANLPCPTRRHPRQRHLRRLARHHVAPRPGRAGGVPRPLGRQRPGVDPHPGRPRLPRPPGPVPAAGCVASAVECTHELPGDGGGRQLDVEGGGGRVRARRPGGGRPARPVRSVRPPAGRRQGAWGWGCARVGDWAAAGAGEAGVGVGVSPVRSKRFWGENDFSLGRKQERGNL